MRVKHHFRLLLVQKTGHVVHRDFYVTRARRAIRSVRRLYERLDAIHVVKNGSFVRTVDLRRKAS